MSFWWEKSLSGFPKLLTIMFIFRKSTGIAIRANIEQEPLAFFSWLELKSIEIYSKSTSIFPIFIQGAENRKFSW